MIHVSLEYPLIILQNSKTFFTGFVIDEPGRMQINKMH